MSNNPRIWYVKVEGITMDVQSLPIDVQERAAKKGIIPYLPSPRTGYRDSKLEREMMGTCLRRAVKMLMRNSKK